MNLARDRSTQASTISTPQPALSIARPLSQASQTLSPSPTDFSSSRSLPLPLPSLFSLPIPFLLSFAHSQGSDRKNKFLQDLSSMMPRSIHFFHNTLCPKWGARAPQRRNRHRSSPQCSTRPSARRFSKYAEQATELVCMAARLRPAEAVSVETLAASFLDADATTAGMTGVCESESMRFLDIVAAPPGTTALLALLM